MTKIKKWLILPFHEPDRKHSTHGDGLFALDGLRGLAVLIVLMSHTAAFGMYGHGSLGVLLFFFLSGFVLTLPYSYNIKKIRRLKENVRYFLNRFLRIVPIYIIAVVTIDLVFNGNGVLIRWGWVLDNISFIKGWNHLWSVAQEVRFYLLFPLLLLFLTFIPKTLPKIVFLLACTYLFYRYRGFHKIDMMDGRFVSFYFWVFLGGVATCFAYKRSLKVTFFDHYPVRTFLSVGSVMILLFIFLSTTHMIRGFWSVIFPSIPQDLKLNGWRIPHIWFFLFMIVMFTATRYDDSIPSRFFKLYFLRHVGLLSYSIYLFHMPVLLKLRKSGFVAEGLFVTVFIITYIIAIFAYIVVEKPFLNLKYRFK